MPLYNPTPSTDPDSGARKIAVWEILDHFVRTEMPGMNLAPGLAKAQCPVLVLAGEEDPVCPLADAQDIAQAVPERWRRFVSLPGCGHGTWRDRPEAAFAVLREFIQS
jgi:proline iminopeptidase